MIITWIIIIILLLSFIAIVYVYKKHEQYPVSLRTAIRVLQKKRDYDPYVGLAEKLGHSANDKLLIIHADDLGLARSVNKATFDALEKGGVNSASIMANCKHLNEVKKYAENKPGIDFGVHLTVTNEWKNYRWKSIMPIKESQSLVNEVGEFHVGIKKFVLRADPGELKKELQAQINKIKKLGIKPTHIDSHEGALFFKKDHFRVYLEVGEKNKLPVFVPKGVDAHFNKSFPKPKNVVVIKNLYMARKGLKRSDWMAFYLNTIKRLKPGLSQLIVHLGYDDNEMKEISVNHPDYGAKWRYLDYDAVTSVDFRSALVKNNVKLVSWGEIKKVLFDN
jgi:predicted glycoside hydrolase/deacetylase ChbG (UPF0249 family)